MVNNIVVTKMSSLTLHIEGMTYGELEGLCCYTRRHYGGYTSLHYADDDHDRKLHFTWIGNANEFASVEASVRNFVSAFENGDF